MHVIVYMYLRAVRHGRVFKGSLGFGLQVQVCMCVHTYLHTLERALVCACVNAPCNCNDTCTCIRCDMVGYLRGHLSLVCRCRSAGAYIHTYTHSSVHLYIIVCTERALVYHCVHICIYIFIFMHTCVHVFLCVRMYVCTQCHCRARRSKL